MTRLKKRCKECEKTLPQTFIEKIAWNIERRRLLRKLRQK